MAIKKILLIFLLVVTVVPAIIIRSPISFMPLVFLFILMLCSFLYIISLTKCYEIIVDTSAIKRYERLSSVDYFIKIVNKGFLVFPHVSFTIALESIDGFTVNVYKFNFILDPKEEKKLYVNIDFPHIGRYIVKISELRIYGFLDMFCLKIKPKWREKLLITPKIYNIQNLEIDTSQPVFTVNFNVPHKISGGDFNDVREYVPGDPIKNIHWKLSAHANLYMTRVMNTDAVSGITVYMDFTVNHNSSFLEVASINDCTVECAYSIALYAFSQYYGVNFIYSESNHPVHFFPKSNEELEGMINSLPKVSIKEKNSIELLIAEYSNTKISLDNIIVLTSKLSVELINALSDCKERGKYPILCYIKLENEQDNIPNSMKNLLCKSGIIYYKINYAKQLSSMLGGSK